MRQITSKDNGVLRTVRLLRQKKHRDKSGQFVAEGWHLLEEAEAHGLSIEFILFSEDAWVPADGTKKKEPHAAKKTERYVVCESLFRSVCDTENPQGVLAVVQKPAFDEKKALARPEGNFVILDRLQDPGNVGTVIRTAEAAGFAGVIVMKGTADIYSPKVVRSAAGSIFRMPVFFYENPEEVVRMLKSAGKRTVAALPEAGVDYDCVQLKKDAALIIGSEARGVCETFRDHADIKVRIPMRGKTESLNVAVAAGILMYEAVRS